MITWVIHQVQYIIYSRFCRKLDLYGVQQRLPDPRSATHNHAQYLARFFCSKSAKSTALILAARTKSLLDRATAYYGFLERA